MPPTPPPELCRRGTASSESQVGESLALCDGVPHAISTWSWVAPSHDSRAAASSPSVEAHAAAASTASASGQLARLDALVLCADFIGSDPALLDEAPVAEGQGAFAARRRRGRARANGKTDAHADAAAAAPAESADADRRPAAIGRAGFGNPGVHVGAVGELSTAGRRAPRSHEVVVGRAGPALLRLLRGGTCRHQREGEQR